MFSTAIKGGKAFAAEQKLKELNIYIYIFRLKYLQRRNYQRLKPLEIFRKAFINMNGLSLEKYGIKSEELEQKPLGSEAYREGFDFRCL